MHHTYMHIHTHKYIYVRTYVQYMTQLSQSVPPSVKCHPLPPPPCSVSHSIIVILDDIDRISLSEVLGEIAGLLDKRGPQYAVWMGPAHGRGGDEETKCYYLREDVFFVATMNKKWYRL